MVGMTLTDTIVLEDDYAKARSAGQVFVRDLKARLVADAVDLPSLPEIALRIRHALAADDVDTEQIIRLIGMEPALATRLLRTANCALFYRGAKPVTNLRMAVTRLGYRMVRIVSVSLAAQQVFIGYAVESLRPYLEEIWRHSIRVAALGYLLAKRSGIGDAEEAFLAGLLHEVGKLYILMQAKDRMELFKSEAAFASIMAERHADIGHAIISAWEFSEDLATAIGEHEFCGLECGDQPSLTEMLAVANFLANRMESGLNEDEMFENLPDFGALALDADTLDWMISASAEEVRVLQQALCA